MVSLKEYIEITKVTKVIAEGNPTQADYYRQKVLNVLEKYGEILQYLLHSELQSEDDVARARQFLSLVARDQSNVDSTIVHLQGLLKLSDNHPSNQLHRSQENNKVEYKNS